MNDQIEQASDGQTNHSAATDQPTNANPTNVEQHRPAGHTAAICLNNLLDQSTTFNISGTQRGVINTDSIEVAPYTIEWVIGWEVGPDKMLMVEIDNESRSFAPFLSTANIALFKKTESGNSQVLIAKKSIYDQIKQAHSPSPLAPGWQESAGAICLGNYIDQATKFTIHGSQEGRIVEHIYTVEPFQFVWALGWETGDDKMVVIETNGGLDRTINLTPFRSTTSVAFYSK